MKLSNSFSLFSALSACVFTAEAFAPSIKIVRVNPTLLNAGDENLVTLENTSEDALDVLSTSTPKASELPAMSTSLPFLTRPPALDGSLAGDVGFDPLGFAKSSEDLMNYREAEVKHARLAMLAAAGWPISELLDKKIADVFGLQPALDSSDRVPSLLNGGLGKISPVYWLVVLGGAAAIDLYGISRAKNAAAGYVPGDLGFDPFGVYPKEKDGQKWMQLAEIKNGRLAMIAIFAFAVQEFVTKMGVVDQTPLFFKPIGQVLKDYTNSGYIQ